MQLGQFQVFQLTVGLMMHLIEFVSSLPLGEADQAADRVYSG